MFDLSPHKFRRAWLALSGNTQFVSLPEQVSKAWVHTLDLSWCLGLTDINVLGGCGYCQKLVDISALERCG